MAGSLAIAGAAVKRVTRSMVVRAVRLVTKYGGRGDRDGEPVIRPRGAGAKGARSTVFSMSSSMKALWTKPMPLPMSWRVWPG